MKKLLVTLIMLLVLAEAGFAQELSLTVTMTIPEVPGLNAPPLDKQTAAAPKKAQEPTAQDQNLIFVKAVTPEKIIQTVYSR